MYDPLELFNFHPCRKPFLSYITNSFQNLIIWLHQSSILNLLITPTDIFYIQLQVSVQISLCPHFECHFILLMYITFESYIILQVSNLSTFGVSLHIFDSYTCWYIWRGFYIDHLQRFLLVCKNRDKRNLYWWPWKNCTYGISC